MRAKDRQRQNLKKNAIRECFLKWSILTVAVTQQVPKLFFLEFSEIKLSLVSRMNDSDFVLHSR
jgi:hypothetical protein